MPFQFICVLSLISDFAFFHKYLEDTLKSGSFSGAPSINIDWVGCFRVLKKITIIIFSIDMARSLEPLVVGRVIGDVVDMFNPVTEFTVRYGNKKVANGCDIRPSASADKPRVQILAPPLSSSLYTLVMVDPDAPSPSEPKYREWLHWIVVDIPEGSDATEGKELVPYMGPQPPTGIHRYVFVLFKQKNGAGMAGTRPPDARNNFRTRQFAAENDLGLPVAAVYFNSQKEISVRKR